MFREDGRLANKRSHCVLLVCLLDELGYLPIDKRGADLLFQVVAARYEVGSIVISTNRPFREWGKLFDVEPNRSARLEQQVPKYTSHQRRIVSSMKLEATPGGERTPAIEILEPKEGAKMSHELVKASGVSLPATGNAASLPVLVERQK